MLSLHGRPAQLCDRVSRREVLRVGGLSGLGLSLPALWQLQAAARDTAAMGIPPTDKTFGRAKNVIYLYLQGGPPQHETFDPKPEAPAEIRGEFKPIATNVPGIQFCELLPRIARIADKLAVVRSVATDNDSHDGSGYWLLTGYKYLGPNSRTIQPTDWPWFGSLVKMLKPSEKLPPLSTVWIPDMMRLNDNVTPAGQTAGFLGGQWDPDRFVGNPADPQYKAPGLRLTDLPPLQLRQRQSLLKQVESHFDAVQRLATLRDERLHVYDRFQQQAFDLLTSGRAREAFDIHREPDKVRDRFGRTQWGQSVLLARRLIEAGVRLVHVNWPREAGDSAVDNPLWDTHAQNADRLEDVLCPQFDVTFAALIDDLHERGLLDETLVVVIGEFGRTPRINGNGGRDHWGNVFSMALAGAGISGGQVYGASDKQGAYPARDRVEGGDLTATLFHLLGINYQGTFSDREGRPHTLTEGKPLFKLLGTEPATAKRVAPGGDIARVPPWDGRLLLHSDFSAAAAIMPADAPSRPKGWRGGTAILTKGNAADHPLGVALVEASPGQRRAAIGLGLDDGAAKKVQLTQGQKAFLAQEVRSPFAGKYALTVFACGSSSSREFFEDVFLKHFICRLVFYQYANPAKKLAERRELASVAFTPRFSDASEPVFEKFELSKLFVNPTPGANFSFGAGMGVSVEVVKSSPGTLELPPAREQGWAHVLVDRVELRFIGKERNETVTV
jgi:hypothetical protein